MSAERRKKAGFEEELKELESIVDRLDDGSLPLEESLKLFEKGIRLSRKLQSRLENASMKVTQLLQDEKSTEIAFTEKNMGGKDDAH